MPTTNTSTIGIPGCLPNRSAERKAESPSTDPTDRSTFRVSTTIVSPTREEREHRRVLEHELQLLPAEEARLDDRGHEHEQGEHRDDPERPDAEDEIDQAPRVRGERRLPARRSCRATVSAWRVAAATIVSSEASAWSNSATSRPSRITSMRSASAQHLRQLRRDHQDRDARRRRARRAAGGSRPWCRRRCRGSARRR